MAAEGRSAYIVMELLTGEPLSALVARERRLPLAVAVDFAIQVLEALAAAHALNVVHRDLKPENVFVTRDGERTVLRVIDFGIAKARSLAGASANLTVSGALMGTPEYMAPEQAASADRADARSDLFAVGVMLYEMLSGARPVNGEDPRVVASKVERGEVKPLIHRVPEVPRELAGLVHRAMAPRPEMRFSSALEMRHALEAIAASKPGSAPPMHPSDAPATSRQASPPRGASLEPGRGTGTMMGDSSAGAPEPPGAGGTDHGAAAYVAPPPPAWSPGSVIHEGGASAPGGNSPPRGGRRGSGGTVWLLGALAVLFGGGVVAALSISRPPSHSQPPSPIATVGTGTPPSAEPPAPSSSSPSEPLSDDLGPLPTVAPRSRPTATPPRSSASGAPRGSASTAPSVAPPQDTPFGLPPFAFPSSLPTFPNPFPIPATSGIVTIPTSFPPFDLPKGPSPSAAPSAPRAPDR